MRVEEEEEEEFVCMVLCFARRNATQRDATQRNATHSLSSLAGLSRHFSFLLPTFYFLRLSHMNEPPKATPLPTSLPARVRPTLHPPPLNPITPLSLL